MIKSQKYEKTSWIKERYGEIGPSIFFGSLMSALFFSFCLYLAVKGIIYHVKEGSPVGYSYAENHEASFNNLDKSAAKDLPDELQKILNDFDNYHVSSLVFESSDDLRNVSQIIVYSTSKSLRLTRTKMLNYESVLGKQFETTSARYQIGYKPKKRLAKMGENLSRESLYSIDKEPERLFHIQRQARSFILYDIKLAPSYNDAVDGNALREALVSLGTHIFCEISDGHFDFPPTAKSFSSTLIGGTSKTACRLVDEGY